MRTPDYVLNTEHTFGRFGDMQTLPVGSFVRPIESQYVPIHVKESSQRNQYHSDERDVYCYTRYGIISIPKGKLRSV